MMWGGRFRQKMDSKAFAFSQSIVQDEALLEYDVACSKAHAEMLAHCGIISSAEADLIAEGLENLLDEYRNGTWKIDYAVTEDIHSAVETYLTGTIGVTAKKMHTARSRNDLVATDLRMWVKESSLCLVKSITVLQDVFLDFAQKYLHVLMPCYTHLQRAMPVSLGYYVLAYVEMLERSKDRFLVAFRQSDTCPLGSCACAGSTLPIDREYVAKQLGFSAVSTHALDSVSDRDFCLDFLHSATGCMMSLSRICEELVLWSTAEWNFIRISDAFTTGSSLMPQKRNPDMVELIRGKSARLIAHYTGFAALLKNLPIGYHRDLQEDKYFLFDSMSVVSDSLEILAEMIPGVKVNEERFRSELYGDFCFATDLLEWLVLKNVAFRSAHEIIGNLIVYCEKTGKKLTDCTLEEYKGIHPLFDETVFSLFSLETCLQRRKSEGSPNPAAVQERIAAFKRSRKHP